MTCYDTPTRRLGGEGLTLVEKDGLWRLQRLTPGDGMWLPTQPPPDLAEAVAPEALDYPIPDGLTPVATFEGRAIATQLTTPFGSVKMTRLTGTVGQSHLVRVILEGEDLAVRDLALTLASSWRISVPRASLAAEAIARANGEAPAPRRLGAPEPFEATSIADSFAHAIGHFTDVLVHYAPDAGVGPGTEPVHQMRVAVRRARSAITVFKHGLGCPDVAAADAELKALGKILAPARDWDVLVTETLPRVAESFSAEPRLRRLIRAAERVRAAHNAALRTWLGTPAFRKLCIGLAWLSVSRSWHTTLPDAEQAASAMTPEAFAAHVLQRRWRKLASAGASIEGLDAPSLHDLRLRAKRARYAMEILRSNVRGKQARRMIERLSHLQAHLGTLNDSAVAGSLLAELGGPRGQHGYAVGLVLGFLAASAATDRPRMLRAWVKFRGTSRFWA